MAPRHWATMYASALQSHQQSGVPSTCGRRLRRAGVAQGLPAMQPHSRAQLQCATQASPSPLRNTRKHSTHTHSAHTHLLKDVCPVTSVATVTAGLMCPPDTLAAT
jgi:hypothetical protein